MSGFLDEVVYVTECQEGLDLDDHENVFGTVLDTLDCTDHDLFRDWKMVSFSSSGRPHKSVTGK